MRGQSPPVALLHARNGLVWDVVMKERRVRFVQLTVAGLRDLTRVWSDRRERKIGGRGKFQHLIWSYQIMAPNGAKDAEAAPPGLGPRIASGEAAWEARVEEEHGGRAGPAAAQQRREGVSGEG